MNTDPMENECAHFPIADYEALEWEVSSLRKRLTTLEPRYAALTELFDRVTRPMFRGEPGKPQARRRGFEFRGQFFAGWACIGIYLELMQRLWTEFPDGREAMASAANRNSRSRAYVARARGDLFQGKSAEWARRHSRRLVDDWFVDTNMNPDQMQAILKSMVTAAGLEWGKDVNVNWR
jgi:hypothetical protein